MISSLQATLLIYTVTIKSNFIYMTLFIHKIQLNKQVLYILKHIKTDIHENQSLTKNIVFSRHGTGFLSLIMCEGLIPTGYRCMLQTCYSRGPVCGRMHASVRLAVSEAQRLVLHMTSRWDHTT